MEAAVRSSLIQLLEDSDDYYTPSEARARMAAWAGIAVSAPLSCRVRIRLTSL